jgi:calcyclin binding protein
MVNIEEMEVDPVVEDADDEEQDLPSQERLLDAISIEEAAAAIERPTARLHLQSLAKKLRRESEALRRMEKNAHMKEPVSPSGSPSRNSSAKSAAPVAVSSPPRPIPTTASTTASASTKNYRSIDRYSFDSGGYNSAFVTLYVPLAGVGSIPKDQVKCDFTKTSFDLTVHDLNGKSYRLFRDNLEKDIDPDKCKLIIKSDEVRIKLAKVKQKDYGGYDYWTKLREAPEKKKKLSEDPQAGIMDLMKQMYDDGDDNMKKMIGETMMKQRTGELNKSTGMDDDKFKM